MKNRLFFATLKRRPRKEFLRREVIFLIKIENFIKKTTSLR